MVRVPHRLRRPALLTLLVVPALVAGPVLSLPTVVGGSVAPRPVTPTIASLPLAGIDATELAQMAVQPSAGAVPEVAGGAARSAQDLAPAVVTARRSTQPFSVAGVTWSGSDPGRTADVVVRIRVREDGRWTPWEVLAAPDTEADAAEGRAAGLRMGTSPIVSGGADGVQVRVDTPGGRVPKDLRVRLVDPGTSPADATLGAGTPAGSASAAASQPPIITRAQWGADESLRGTISYNTTVKAIIIHHTAGSNGYSADTAAAQVRGIYAYDTQGLGWSDIAYNFLVDKFGRIYEGRAGSITQPVRGAHAGGFNTDTMGVSALGNYETASAPTVMIEAMARVTGWKLSQYGRDVNGSVTLTSEGGGTSRYDAGTRVTIPVVAPHQTTGYTLCPGQYVLPLMPTIRSKAAAYAGGTTTTATALPAQKWSGADVFDADRAVDIVAIDRTTSRLMMYHGAGNGTFGTKTAFGTGWQDRDLITGTGDLTGDGLRDFVSRQPSNGALWLYVGDGKGSFVRATSWGVGWNSRRMLSGVGDWTKDGRNDLLATDKATGALVLYAGTSAGGLAAGVSVGKGWSVMDMLTGVGDFDGDAHVDVVARYPTDGSLWLYRSDGSGGWLARRQIGTGWNVMRELAGLGDANGDGRVDLLAKDSAGGLWIYPGNGAGGFLPRLKAGVGWGSMDLAG